MDTEQTIKIGVATPCKSGCGCAKASKPEPAVSQGLVPATTAPAAPAEDSADAAKAVEPRENRRKSQVDRRMGVDRRQKTAAEAGYTGPERRSGVERREATGLERRRGPGRRRADDRREAEEGEMNTEQFEFIMAIETYKKVNKRIYPTWTEVLEVLRQLGYRKVKPREIHLENVPEARISAA